MGKPSRTNYLKARRARHTKLFKFRKILSAAKTEAEKEKVRQKIVKIAPWLAFESSVKKSQEGNK